MFSKRLNIFAGNGIQRGTQTITQHRNIRLHRDVLVHRNKTVHRMIFGDFVTYHENVRTVP